MRVTHAALVACVAACGARTDLASAAGAGGPCTAVDVEGLDNVVAIATDERDVVYWLSNWDVVRHDHATTTVLVDGGDDEPTALAVDGERVLYVRASGTLDAVPRDGGQPVILASGLSGVPFRVAPMADGTIAVVSGDGKGGTHLLRVGSDGTPVQTWSTTDVIEADAFDSASYFAAIGGVSRRLVRVDVASGAESTMVDGIDDVTALATDAPRLYWFSESFANPAPAADGVWSMPESGGPAKLVFAPPAPYLWAGLAADASGVYLSTASLPGSTTPSVIGKLWRVRPDGEVDDLAGPTPGDGRGLGFYQLALGSRAVHWIAAYDLPDGVTVDEVCK